MNIQREIENLECAFAGEILSEQIRMRSGHVNRMSDRQVCDLVREVRREDCFQDDDAPTGAALVITLGWVAVLLLFTGVVLWSSR